MDEAIVRTETPTEYFRELVESAIQRQHLSTREVTSFYLVHLLAGFIHCDRSGPDDNQALGVRFVSALGAAGARQRHELRDVGDQSLFISGFFADSLHRSLVDIDYCIQLGEQAYGSLARTGDPALGDVFDELAEKFTSFVDVLGDVSERTALTSNTDLLRLYERWARTGAAGAPTFSPSAESSLSCLSDSDSFSSDLDADSMIRVNVYTVKIFRRSRAISWNLGREWVGPRPAACAPASSSKSQKSFHSYMLWMSHLRAGAASPRGCLNTQMMLNGHRRPSEMSPSSDGPQPKTPGSLAASNEVSGREAGSEALNRRLQVIPVVRLSYYGVVTQLAPIVIDVHGGRPMARKLCIHRHHSCKLEARIERPHRYLEVARKERQASWRRRRKK